MPSSQPLEPDGVNSEPDIPDIIRAWELSSRVARPVRRPSTLPDPQSYHVVLDPQVIFELDEKQEDGSIETILVVPYSCTKCRSSKQACSRSLPACARCVKSGSQCVAPQEGYQKIPGPKWVRGGASARTKMGGDVEGSTSLSARQAPAGRSRTKRIVSGSKRSHNSESESDSSQPPSKTLAKVRSQKRKARRLVVASSDEMDTESEAPKMSGPAQATPTVTPAPERGTPTWRFVNHPRARDGGSSREGEQVHAIPSDPPIPRIWTNSLEGLLNMFPALAKSSVGFSYFQSETPILLLDTNCARGHWTSPTTLSITLLWDFDCHDSDLEVADESEAGGLTQLHSDPSTLHSPESALSCEAGTMDPCVTSTVGSSTTAAAVSVSISDAQIRRSDDMVQNNRHIHESHDNGRSSIEDKAAYTESSIHPFATAAPENSSTSQAPSPSNRPQPCPQPRIPLIKPDEVETLLNSKLRFIPLLVWIFRDCELMPCKLPQEYAYLCMGLFFVSDLHHLVTRHVVCSTTGNVQGQVCWDVVLQWAPGGEDALFDCDAPSSRMTVGLSPPHPTRNLLEPWWFRPADASPPDGQANRPRNLRMQIFSCIPLDLLAEFHPSEVFPRGWFCNSCGMINIQQFFRHQICQSTICRPRREEGVPLGKVDPLTTLRGPYQSNILIRPTNHIPSAVVADRTLWDDGMQSWNYCVREGVALCHVFTGNQKHLQDDASALLERIQREALLRKENRLSPYFVHTTKLLHSSDGSETRVPGGTPDCTRIAYYTLCDFVQRYAEMDNPRFGEVRIQAWANAGSKRGGVLRASKSPVVIHCLGVEAVVNLTPKGGYRDAVASTVQDKGEERAQDKEQAGLIAKPCGGPPCLPAQDREHQASRPEASETPTGVEGVGEQMIATDIDIVSQFGSLDAGSVTTTDANNSHYGTEMEVACRDVTKQGKERGHKKSKVIKDKNRAAVPEISMTLVHGDCVVLFGDDFECQIVRFGTSILVIGFPEET